MDGFDTLSGPDAHRRAELNNVKEQDSLKIWKADAAGNIKLSEAESGLRCDISTELEVMNAMKRQGIAYEIANLMSFEKHELIVNLLFAGLQRDVLEGYKKLSISQLAAADREIHLRLAEKTRAGLPLGPM